MQRPITRGAAAGAGLIFHVFAQDSAATNGAGKASVAFSSWACRYIRNGEAISGAITPEDITTIGTYAAPTANTNIRIKAVDNTNMIGVYEVQIHADWVNATNSCQSLTIYLTATGVAVLPIQIPLEAVNRQDPVRGGMTALPNAAAEAAGGLFTRGTGAGQISQAANGQVDVNAVAISGDSVAADNLETAADGGSFNLGGGGVIAASVTGAVGSVTGAVGSVTGAVGSVTADVGITQTGADKVWASAARTLTSFGTLASDVWAVATRALTDKAGFSLSAAGIQAIWDALTSALTTVGSVGKLLVDNVNAAISSRSSHSAADVWAAGTRTLTSFGTLIADIWASVTRSLTDKADFTLTSAYDPAKTAAQAGDAMTLTAGERTSVGTAVWASATRTLTSFGTLVADIWASATSALTTVGSIGKLFVDRIDAAITSRMATFAYTAPLDAAGVRAAVGLGSANLDTQIDALPTAAENRQEMDANSADFNTIIAKTNLIPAAPAAVGDIPSANQNADALLDRANGIEAGVTLRQAQRVQLSASAGKLSGAATTTVSIRDTGDSKNRIVATVDGSGNRTAVTLDTT